MRVVFLPRFLGTLPKALFPLLTRTSATCHDQVAASQLGRIIGAHGVLVYVLGCSGGQPVRLHALKQRDH
jgi:hypothetical protein